MFNPILEVMAQDLHLLNITKDLIHVWINVLKDGAWPPEIVLAWTQITKTQKPNATRIALKNAPTVQSAIVNSKKLQITKKQISCLLNLVTVILTAQMKTHVAH